MREAYGLDCADHFDLITPTAHDQTLQTRLRLSPARPMRYRPAARERHGSDPSPIVKA